MLKNAFNNKIIWITGASSGIGRELVEQLVATNAVIIACSRNINSLQELQLRYPSKLELVVVDVTDITSIQACMVLIEKKYGRIDIAILNAGNCTYIDIASFNVNTIRKNFAVNFFGLANCIEACLPLLRKSAAPHLVGMSSAAALLALPRAEGYGSAKAASRYMLEALQSHLKKENILVSIILPGFVKTPLTDQNDFPMPFMVSVNEAARCIISGIYKRKFEISFPRRLIWMLKLLATLPNKIRALILSKTVKPK